MKPETLQLRTAVPDDASAIASVLYESFIEYKSSYTLEGFAATTPGPDEVKRRIVEGPMWVVLSDQVLVGTVSVVSKEKSLYIRGMAVIPKARGQKLGELLLAHIENFAAARGFQRLFLSTTPFLTGAIRLYERFGFQRTADGPHDLFGTPIFTMAKTLEVPVTDSA